MKKVLVTTLILYLLVSVTLVASAAETEVERPTLNCFAAMPGQIRLYKGFADEWRGKSWAEVEELACQRLETWLYQSAERLGVEVEGKDQEEIWSEVQKQMENVMEERLYAIADKLGIETAGLTREEVRQAVKEELEQRYSERVYAVAERLGIDTQDKSLEQIREEIRERQRQRAVETLTDIAAELGIDSSNMTPWELRREIINQLSDQKIEVLQVIAEHLGLDSEGKSAAELVAAIREKIQQCQEGWHRFGQMRPGRIERRLKHRFKRGLPPFSAAEQPAGPWWMPLEPR